MASVVKKIVFVLGGPGAGKGTLCNKIANKFDYLHLSAGDLLRSARDSEGHKHGDLIREYIREGKIVPREITISLLKEAMETSSKRGFLIDGFPRAVEQAEGFEAAVRRCDFVLFLDCPQKAMEDRILKRSNEFKAAKKNVRVDDNLEAMRKRFKVYEEQTLPVIEFYSQFDLVRRIDACKSPDEVFAQVVPLFEDKK